MLSRILRALGGFVVAAAISSPAVAAGGAFVSPRAGATLTGGSIAEARWSALEAGWTVAADVDEAELVLSIDGGNTFPVRVSAELSPRATSYRWRVPALPTSRARVALRIGARGEQESERIVLVGPEFAIEAGTSGPEPLVRGSAEWWTEQALTESSVSDLLGECVGDAGERLVALSADTDVDRPGPALSLVAPGSSPSIPVPAAARQAPACGLAAPPAFASLPLRL